MGWLARAWDRIRRATSLVDAGEAARPTELVHFSPEPYGYPLCGARWGLPWAMNIEAVTCLRCRELGMPLHIQHWVNNR